MSEGTQSRGGAWTLWLSHANNDLRTADNYDDSPEAAGDSAHKLNLGDPGGPGSVANGMNDAG